MLTVPLHLGNGEKKKVRNLKVLRSVYSLGDTLFENNMFSAIFLPY